MQTTLEHVMARLWLGAQGAWVSRPWLIDAGSSLARDESRARLVRRLRRLADRACLDRVLGDGPRDGALNARIAEPAMSDAPSQKDH
jgi:hypothetical protein